MVTLITQNNEESLYGSAWILVLNLEHSTLALLCI